LRTVPWPICGRCETLTGMGEGGSVDDHTVAEVAASMRRLLAAIDAGEITADLDHVAYLRGAADTLAMLADFGESVPKPRSAVPGMIGPAWLRSWTTPVIMAHSDIETVRMPVQHAMRRALLLAAPWLVSKPTRTRGALSAEERKRCGSRLLLCKPFQPSPLAGVSCIRKDRLTILSAQAAVTR
jgi:hypothetical protein